MMKRKTSKKNYSRFFIICIVAIFLLPFSINAQDDDYKQTINIDKATKAAESGNTDAMVALGNAYMSGKFVVKDSIEAMKWFTRAAEKGNASSMYILGFIYDNGKFAPKDTALALKWYTKGAEAGDANAMNNLGVKYRKGRWVNRDYKKAMKLFKKSADAGNAYGMLNVGQMYEYAKGVERSNETALQWYQKAAEKSGIKIGCYNLGYFYEYGKGGLAVDVETAISFYNKAVSKEEKAACMYHIGNIYEYGKGTIKADINEAIKYYQVSADAGNIIGMYFLGRAFEISQKSEEAKVWYTKAFANCEKEIKKSIDVTELMVCLALMYENGKGTEKNMDLATAWYKQAAELGNEDAEVKLKSVSGN